MAADHRAAAGPSSHSRIRPTAGRRGVEARMVHSAVSRGLQMKRDALQRSGAGRQTRSQVRLKAAVHWLRVGAIIAEFNMGCYVVAR